MPKERYTYSVLPPNSFRLLRIEPKRMFSDTIRCSMTTVSFEDAPEYHCLSYTWGNPFPKTSPQHQIFTGAAVKSKRCVLCNGKRLLIGENLFHALSALRGCAKEELKSFWIDQICIFQESLQERSAQVAKMGQIYRSAASVIIWLGPADGETPKAVETINVLNAWDPRLLPALKEFESTGEEYSNPLYPAPSLPLSYWNACASLLCRSWFNRLWIIQEFLLARRIRIFCGSMEFSWNDLENICTASRTIADRPMMNAMHSRYRTAQSHARYREWSDQQNQTYYLSELKKPIIASGGLSILEFEIQVLSRLRGSFNCFDPRDRIYGLQGLCQSTALNDPNYNNSVDDVYTTFATICLNLESKLDFLAYVEDSGLRQIKKLPSWVPDYSADYQPRMLLDFKARRSLTRDVPPPKVNSKVLEISGIQVSRITDIGFEDKPFGKNNIKLEFLLNFPEIYPTGEGVPEVASQVLAAYSGETKNSNTCHQALSEYFLERTSHLINNSRGNEVQAQHRATYEKLLERDPKGILPRWNKIQTMVESWNISYDDPSQEWRQHSLFDMNWMEVFHLASTQIFRTDQNYMGIGHRSVQVSDEVWLSPHSQTPLILRPAGNGDYVFVGEAYLHGIMFGEIVEKDPNKFRTVRIL